MQDKNIPDHITSDVPLEQNTLIHESTTFQNNK